MATKKKAKKPAKVSSKRLATIAAKYMQLPDDFWSVFSEFERGKEAKRIEIHGHEINALAASVLSQAEKTEPKKAAKVRK